METHISFSTSHHPIIPLNYPIIIYHQYYPIKISTKKIFLDPFIHHKKKGSPPKSRRGRPVTFFGLLLGVAKHCMGGTKGPEIACKEQRPRNLGKKLQKLWFQEKFLCLPSKIELTIKFEDCENLGFQHHIVGIEAQIFGTWSMTNADLSIKK